jgi:hypothetical protein
MQLKRSFSYGVYLFFGFVNAALAQNFSGLQASNFNGIHAIYQNPAGIADEVVGRIMPCGHTGRSV